MNEDDEVPRDPGPLPRMSKDLRASAKLLTPKQAEYLVDNYYIQQKQRIRSGHQLRALEKYDEPHDLMNFFTSQGEVLENQVRSALDAFSNSQLIGKWARSITGVGPVIAAGLIAGFDIHRAPTVGHFWRIAGLNPEDKKQKGKKLVWNPRLKRLMFILGESFTKVQANENDIYGKVFLERRKREIAKNDAGDFVATAQEALATRDYFRDTSTRAWYEGRFMGGFTATYYATEPGLRLALVNKAKLKEPTGMQMLPPGRIQLRAQRVAVKLFLSHLHHVWHEITFGIPPVKPYVIDQLGHAHYLAPPNWPMQ